MEKSASGKSGFFNPRVLIALALCSVGVFLAMLSFAATSPEQSNSISGVTTVPEVFTGMSTGRDVLAAFPPGGTALLFGGQQDNPGRGVGDTWIFSPAAPAGSWAIISSPNTSATQHNYLQAVTCVSTSDCWAVGHSLTGSVNQTLIERWNGSSWTIVASPNTSPTQSNYLYGVTCTSASDCWAAGYYFNGNATQTLIERWDGTSWTIVASPNTSATRNNFFYGVTCVSASDCWATGGYYTGSVNQTLIERWDGTSWAIVTSPNASTTDHNTLYGVTCASASECWGVGYYVSTINSNLGGTNQTLIVHWDGSSWTVSPSANSLPIQDNHLFSVTCVSASECWAVGDFLNNSGLNSYAQTLIERWDGTSWTIANSPNTSDTQTNVLFGVACTSASECWAAGYYFNAGVSQTLIERWNGSSWEIASSANTSAAESNVLHDVTCLPASDCWAVGDFATATFPPIGRTLTERYTVSPPTPTSAASRKTHGTAGDFDIDLPLAGDPGIECRIGGTTNDYQIIVTFPSAVTFDHAAVTSGNGSVSDTSGNGATEITVNLTGVTNAQKITLTLFGVNDGARTGDVSVQMSVLIGDVNASGVVTSGDTNLCKAQALQPVTSSNFRSDVNASGSITTGDVNIIKQNALSQLPP